MKNFSLFVVSAFCLSAASAQEAARPALFVAPLDGDVSQVLAWQPALGEGLAEMLITEITKIDKFDVLESTALEKLKDEMRLMDEGLVAKGEGAEKGGWKGADYMFRGKVTRFGSKSTGVGLGGFAPSGLGNLGVKTSKSDVRIDWRLVDVATRKIVKTGSAVGAETGLGFDVGVAVKGSGGRIGFDNKEFMNSALGKATVKALGAIMTELKATPVSASGRQLARQNSAAAQQAQSDAAQAELRKTPGKVLAVASKTAVIVSLGSRHGFKAGDKLKLYETIDTKDDKGTVVFTEEKLVGEVTLESVQDERSKANYAGNLEIKAGWVVKAN